MRFSVFVALLVATFAVCFSSFAGAEQNNLRRLKSTGIKLTDQNVDAATDEKRDASSLLRKFASKLKKSTAANKVAGRAAGAAAKNTALKEKEVQKMGKAVADVVSKDPTKLPMVAKILIGLFGAAGATAIISVAVVAYKTTP
jgi:hypothetical protein